jgi:hypothetical protein
MPMLIKQQYFFKMNFLKMNKGKTLDKETREEGKKKDQSPNKRPHSKVKSAQWGALRGENTKPKT